MRTWVADKSDALQHADGTDDEGEVRRDAEPAEQAHFGELDSAGSSDALQMARRFCRFSTEQVSRQADSRVVEGDLRPA